MDRKANPMLPTLNEALHRASIFLEQNGHDGSLARYYWQSVHDWNLTQLVSKLNQQLTAEDYFLYQSALDRIVKDEPIQYITGYADFMGEQFEVTPDTLIPREDTAGLIEIAYHYLQQNPSAKVLDIGTGSGIIPIMLAKQYPNADIWACDISPEALKVAKKNMNQHKATFNLVESDLFEAFDIEPRFDLVISNPPYISLDELDVMDESVKKFEPKQALFAENQGLAIYERIANEIAGYIQPQGMILLEIGYRQAKAVTALFQTTFSDAKINVKKDINGHDRYVIVTL